MLAKSQYELSARDLEVVLALARAKTLAQASVRLDIDSSTAFRLLQRIEKGLGQRLFERNRRGYLPTELGQRLVQHAEAVEGELQSARGMLRSGTGEIAGLVRISAVDAVLNYLVVPVLGPLLSAHPHLRVEFAASNALVSLSQRDADVALRSTRKPPPHLIGRRLGSMHFAVYTCKARARQLLKRGRRLPLDQLAKLPWVGVDEAMPEHPGAIWRKRALPNVRPALLVDSMLTAVQVIEAGMAIGVVAEFHAKHVPELVPLTSTLDNCEIDLWMLTHPESRHLRRIAVVAHHFAEHLAFDA